MQPTLTQVFFKARLRASNQVAFRYKKNKEWISRNWKDCYTRAESIGGALLAFGLTSQDKVAIVSNTRAEWLLADMGILGAGFVTVPIYPSNLPEEVSYILNDSKAKVLILEDSTQLAKWRAIEFQCPHIQKVVCIESGSQLEDDILSWDEFLDEGDVFLEKNPQAFENSCLNSKMEDVATLIYTSGTTGQPKGVVLTHLQIHSEVSELFNALGVDDRDESLCFLPFSHIMGRVEGWGAIYIGYTLNFAESIEKIRFNLEETKPTILVAVPRIFEKIYAGILSQMEVQPLRNQVFQWALQVGKEVSQSRTAGKSLSIGLIGKYIAAKKLVFAPLKKKMGGRLRFAVSGGAPLNKELGEFFHAADLLLLEGYGLTETTAAIAINTPFHFRFGTVGRPLGDANIRFEKDGEILVRSAKVMQEYFLDPQATSEAFVDGYFRTGDIGEFTQDGFLKVTDRKKDLIKTAGGKYVAPQKLEGLLKMNPFISNVLIHGDQKKYIVALLTLNEEQIKTYALQHRISYQNYASLTQHEEIQKLARKAVADANSHLASYETIKNFAVLKKDFTIEDGELTPSLKVKRKFCDQKYKDWIEPLFK